NPYSPDAPLEARVKSYLSVNCSVCHVGEGGGNAKMQLDLRTPLRRMRVVDEIPIHNKFDLPDARIVTPGAPERSVMYYRISNTGTGRMPPLVTTELDRQAIKFIGDWIRSLPATAK
ncbi:PQQ-dependent sugar dehydrogenase, partial [Singulisphaera rosea]